MNGQSRLLIEEPPQHFASVNGNRHRNGEMPSLGHPWLAVALEVGRHARQGIWSITCARSHWPREAATPPSRACAGACWGQHRSPSGNTQSAASLRQSRTCTWRRYSRVSACPWRRDCREIGQHETLFALTKARMAKSAMPPCDPQAGPCLCAIKFPPAAGADEAARRECTGCSRRRSRKPSNYFFPVAFLPPTYLSNHSTFRRIKSSFCFGSEVMCPMRG